MLDRISDSRTRLFDALSTLLESGRVDKYVPKQIVSPAVWIERHSWSQSRENGAAMIAVAWRIVIATDSDSDQEWLDTMSAKVHDAAVRARFRPLFAEHQTIDIGGMTTVALIVTVDDQIAAATLCPPEAPPVQQWKRKVPA